MSKEVANDVNEKEVWPPAPSTEQIQPNQKPKFPKLIGFMFGCLSTIIMLLAMKYDIGTGEALFNLSFVMCLIGVSVSVSDLNRSKALHWQLGVFLSVFGIALSILPVGIIVQDGLNN